MNGNHPDIARLRDLLHECAISAPAEQETRLCEAASLLGEPSGFTELLAARAHESAALALLGANTGWLLSRGAGGQALASVVLPGGDDVTAEASTPALALLAALAAAWIESAQPRAPRSVAPALRLH